MRNRLKKKLHSRRGASLTFALLLFMVCAAVGSVVLAASMSAAGRASDSGEYDRRYFAVTSAAQLLRETLDGQSFTFEVTERSYRWETTTTSGTEGSFTFTTDSDDFDADDDDYPTAYELYVNGSRITGGYSPDDLLGKAAAVLFDVTVADTEEFFEAFAPGSTAADWFTDDGVLPDMTLAVAPQSGDSIGALTVAVKPSLTVENGVPRLLLDVQNADGAEKYTLRLTLAAGLTAQSPRSADVLYSSDYDADTLTRTEIYQQSETRAVTVNWRVISTEKAGE